MAKNEVNQRAVFVAKFLSEVFETPQKFVCTDKTNINNAYKVIYNYIRKRYGIKWPSEQDFKEAIKMAGIKIKKGVNSGYGLNEHDREKLSVIGGGVFIKISPKDIWALRSLSVPGNLHRLERDDKIERLESFSKKIIEFEIKNAKIFNNFFCNVGHIEHIIRNQ